MKKVSGYHRQGRVENAFFRYKSIIGDGLRARSPAGQGSEVVLGCEILNRMTALGRPVSYRIGQVRILSVGIVRASDDSCNNAPLSPRTRWLDVQKSPLTADEDTCTITGLLISNPITSSYFLTDGNHAHAFVADD